MAKEILIADSDKGDQEEFRRIYEGTDYHLVFAENGEDALLRIKLFKPDLVIAGTGLGEKGGLELCETIKGDPEFKHLPFLLLTGMFEDVSEKDRLRVLADGIISKPLREGEIVGLTDQLMEEAGNGRIREVIPEQEKEWTVLPEKGGTHVEKKGDFVLDELDEDNEEIIELVDVVEEPEPRLSIDDFVSTKEAEPSKAEPVGDIPPLDSWDKLFGEEKGEERKPEKKPSDEAFEFVLEGGATGEEPGPRRGTEAGPEASFQEDLDFSLEEEKETGPKVDLRPKAKPSSDEELFEKIELEEILEKVERLQPAIEKEWPAYEKGEKGLRADAAPKEESINLMDLGEFESALKTEVKAEEKAEPQEAELQPFDGALKEEKTAKEEFESLILDEAPLDLTPPAVEAALEEEPLSGLAEEDLPLEFAEEELGEDEIGITGWAPEVKEEEIEILEEAEPEAVAPGPQPVIPVPEVQPESLMKEGEVSRFIREIQSGDIMEKAEALGGLEEDLIPDLHEEVAPPVFAQEGRPPDIFKAMETLGPFQEMGPPSFGEVEVPKGFIEEVHPPSRVLERELQGLIGKGVQEMMEGFITKVLPEMTQNILNLTVERIETMVKEVIPDLAEKAIQEEIKRLQKGDKEEGGK